MSKHIIPLYTLKKAKKNGTWKLVQQSLLEMLKNGTSLVIEDDDGKVVVEVATQRDFANWWNSNLR